MHFQILVKELIWGDAFLFYRKILIAPYIKNFVVLSMGAFLISMEKSVI